MQKGKFLMGLGLGIVCGSLLLQLMYSVEQMEKQADLLSSEEPNVSDAFQVMNISEQQLFAAAEALHYQLYPADQILYTEEQLDEAVEHAVSQAVKEAAEQWQSERKLVFVINPGMRPLDVANLLTRLELIESPDQLLQAISEQRLSTRIVSGTYEFEGHPSIDEILEEITY